MKKEKNSKWTKKILFTLLLIALLVIITLIVKNSNLKSLEGYMYSFASDITTGTSSDSTSSNATSCNSTSGDATSSNATSCNATSSNVTNNFTKIVIPEDIKQKTEVKLANERVEYDNSEITSKIIEEIGTNENIKSITIDLDENTKISKELFKTIKGKAKQLIINTNGNQIIFYGEIITEAKEIDANISYNLVNEDPELKNIIKSGIIINFIDNGNLPGSAEIRIKITNEMKNVLKEGKMYIYFYNEEEKNFTQIAEVNNYTEDEFIEFTINHNSKYIITNDIIENANQTDLAQTEENKVSFLENNKIYLMIILISVLTIIIVGVILIVDKKTKRKVD